MSRKDKSSLKGSLENVLSLLGERKGSTLSWLYSLEDTLGTKLPWKKGRGTLAILVPLLGTWHADADTPDGRPGTVHCERRFQQALNGSYIELTAIWQMGNTVYEERAFFGRDAVGALRFWSFTSNGKQSQGELTDVSDIHPEAIGFIAQMPEGIARQAYWPDQVQGMHWVVEAQTKEGWDRFVDHHYVLDIQPDISTGEDLPAR